MSQKIMAKTTIDEVVRAIDTLHKNPDPQKNREDMEKANTWLCKFQNSLEAWEISNQLLHLQRDIETSHFAAQTMRTKIQYSFDELPMATYEALRESLISHLTNLCESPHVVTTQLELALADLALQTNWQTVVMDTIQIFHDSLPKLIVLLDFLSYLPEEVPSRTLGLGSTKREEWKEIFKRDCTNVITLLAMSLEQCGKDVNVQTCVLYCLASWMKLKTLPVEQLAQSSLILLPFQVFNQLSPTETLYKAATSSIRSALILVHGGQPYIPLALVLMEQIKALIPLYHAAVDTGDHIRANCLCQIFTELGETVLLYCIDQPNTTLGDISLFEILLDCLAHPDKDVADITFNLWYLLSEELYIRSNDDVIGRFKPYIQKLIHILRRQCELEADPDEPAKMPHRDDPIYDFRYGASQLIKDVIFIVGSLHSFEEMFKLLCEKDTSWTITESCVFIMSAVASSIRESESELVPMMMDSLLTLPPGTHVAVQATVLDLLAELAPWINKHSEFLDRVLAFILVGLRSRDLSTHAAFAIQAICSACQESMKQHFEGLLQIVEAGDSLGISPDAVTGLYKSAARVVCLMTHQEITEGVSRLCQLVATPLQQCATPTNSKGDPSIWLDRLAAIFKNCNVKVPENTPHPCMPAIAQLWDIISCLLLHYQTNVRVIERACRCLRFMIRCVRTSGRDMLLPLLQLMHSIYPQQKHSCFLYLLSIIIDEFGHLPDLTEDLMAVVVTIASMAFSIMGEGKGFDPDGVDDLYRLCGRCLQRCPTPFLKSPIASAAVQYGLAVATIHQRDANASLMMFFKDLLGCTQVEDSTMVERQTIVSELMSKHGQDLMNALITDLACLPVYMSEEVTVVVYEMFQCFPKDTSQWLIAAVYKVCTSTYVGKVRITEEQKQAFISHLTECANNLEGMKDVTRDFAHLFR
jgi:transportin-3